MKEKILITHVHMNSGGIESSLVNLLSSLDKNKYDIDLILYYPIGDFYELIPSWVNIIPVWNKSNFLKKITLSRNIIFRILKNIIYNKFTVNLFVPNKKYDCAIGYSGYFNFTDLIAAKSKSKKKLVWIHADFYTQYNIDNEFKKKFKTLYKKYKYFDKIVCVSEKASNNFKLLCPELSNKVCYQWNINKERFISEKSNITLDGKYNIITIARLYKYKGIERLVNTAKILKEKNIECKIYILGDGPNKQSLSRQIKSLNLEDMCIMLGNIPNVFPILKQANLYVLPSDCEGFSSVTLESLIAGVPVVSTPTASSIDIFNNIAPANSMILTKDFTDNSIADSILSAISGKINKDFKFNISELNISILNSFEKLVKVDD